MGPLHVVCTYLHAICPPHNRKYRRRMTQCAGLLMLALFFRIQMAILLVHENTSTRKSATRVSETDKDRLIAYLRSSLSEKRNVNGSTQLGMTHLPGIHTYLPHLRDRPDLLEPALEVSGNRTHVRLVIGVPTIPRKAGSYLKTTLNSIFDNLGELGSLRCLVIVFIAEPSNQTYVTEWVNELQNQFKDQVKSGLLDIIAPKPEFYPSFDDLPLSMEDNKERVKWRTKQNLDYAYLMLYAYRRGQYYMQLEDDVIARPEFYTWIEKGLSSHRHLNWIVLKYSPLGFIGKLFRSGDLPLVAEFLLMFHKEKPGDWLLDNIVTTKVCGKNMTWHTCAVVCKTVAIQVRPSLFQHIGVYSSLNGKIQMLKDKTFRDGTRNRVMVRTEINPTPTNILCTIQHYGRYKIEYAYDGSGFFWGIFPVRGDVIDFLYEPPIRIKRFRIVSGRNGNDTFPSSTTVEVRTEGSNQTSSENGTFQVVGHFNEGGVAEAKIPDTMLSVHVFRIQVHVNMTSWVNIPFIEIKVV